MVCIFKLIFKLKKGGNSLTFLILNQRSVAPAKKQINQNFVCLRSSDMRSRHSLLTHCTSIYLSYHMCLFRMHKYFPSNHLLLYTISAFPMWHVFFSLLQFTLLFCFVVFVSFLITRSFSLLHVFTLVPPPVTALKWLCGLSALHNGMWRNVVICSCSQLLRALAAGPTKRGLSLVLTAKRQENC